MYHIYHVQTHKLLPFKARGAARCPITDAEPGTSSRGQRWSWSVTRRPVRFPEPPGPRSDFQHKSKVQANKMSRTEKRQSQTTTTLEHFPCHRPGPSASSLREASGRSLAHPACGARGWTGRVSALSVGRGAGRGQGLSTACGVRSWTGPRSQHCLWGEELDGARVSALPVGRGAGWGPDLSAACGVRGCAT